MIKNIPTRVVTGNPTKSSITEMTLAGRDAERSRCCIRLATLNMMTGAMAISTDEADLGAILLVERKVYR